MNYLTIGLTPNVFGLQQKQWNNLSEHELILLNVIRQHEIVLSKGISELYSSILGSEVVENFITLNGNIQGKCRYVVSNKKYASGIEELLDIVSKLELKILVGEKKEIQPYSSKNINLISAARIGQNKFTELSKYTFPVCYHVKSGYKCNDIAKWFGILFKGEKKITIQDRYIMNLSGIAALKMHYLPYIEKGTRIEIYCNVNYCEDEEIIKKQIGEEVFNEYDVNVFACGLMKHDRYIELSGIRIQIGAGLGILEQESIKETQECDINIIRIDDSQRLNTPEVVRQVI